jgi:hypothetical protein
MRTIKLAADMRQIGTDGTASALHLVAGIAFEAIPIAKQLFAAPRVAIVSQRVLLMSYATGGTKRQHLTSPLLCKTPQRKA